MPLDPQIPLSVNIPQQAPVSPLGSIAQLMQLRGLDSEIALRNAQVEQAGENTRRLAAEAREKQLDLRDQNFLQQASLNPDTHKRLALGDTSDIAGHVQLKTEQALQEKALKMQQDRATLNTTQLTQRNTGAAEIGSTVAGLLNLKDADGNPDLAQINANLPSAIDGLSKSGAFAAVGIDPAKLQGQQVTSVDQLHSLAASMGAETAVNDKILAQKKEQAATSASSATARKETAEADKQEMLNTMLRNAQQGIQAGQHPIDSILPASVDSQANSAYKAAYNTALATGGPDAAKSILDAAARHATELSPAVMNNKARTAAAEASARSPIETRTAVNTEAAKAALAPAPVRGILNPTLQTQVISDQAKASDEYQQKVGDAQRLQQFIDAARGGNEAASKMISVAEVREILNRVTNTELAAAGSGASAARRIKDWIETGATGKPSEATLHDVEQLGQMVQGAALRTYQGKVQNLNALGAKYPLQPPSIPGAPAATPAKPSAAHTYKAGDTRVINGKTYTRDANGNWN